MVTKKQMSCCECGGNDFTMTKSFFFDNDIGEWVEENPEMFETVVCATCGDDSYEEYEIDVE